MLVRLRAATAVAMLAGVFVLAALVLAALAAAIWWVVRTGSSGGALVGALFSTAAFVIVVALVRVVRTTPDVPSGLSVSPADEPALWAIVRDAAAGIGTREPDDVRLVADANAGVAEDHRLLGLVGGSRVLYIGFPLLQTMTRAELLWVVCHEMGHYSERHTALSGLTRRGLSALSQIVEGLGRRHVLGWVFRGYRAVYARVVHELWRRQELDADRWAASLAGADVGISALRRVAATASSWARFVGDYGSIGASVGIVPQHLFAGYATFLSDPARREDVDRLIADERRSPFDTHPPTAKRIERLAALPPHARPEEEARAGDEEALRVLADPEQTAVDVEAQLAREGSLTSVPWERAVLLGNRRRDEDRAVRVMSAVSALASEAPDLSLALHLSAQGRGRELAVLLAGRELDTAEAADLEARALQVLVRTALVGAGHASYALRWDRTDVIVDEAGMDVDVAGLVQGVPGNPASADWVLELLRAEGISRTWNPALSSRLVGPTGPEVLAVLVMKQSWSYAYPVLYVTEAGLGIRRLGYREYMSIPPLSPQKTPAQLLAHAMCIDGTSLLGDPDTELVPWDRVEHVTYVDGSRPRLTVRRDGRDATYRAIGVGGDAFGALARFAYGRMSLG